MKLLHLIYSDGVAGAEKHLVHLLPGLQKHNIDCHLQIVCPARAYDVFQLFARGMEDLGISTQVFVANKSNFIGAARKIHRYCIKNNIDVIHSHLINADIIAVLVKKLFNSKITLISTKHGYEEVIQRDYEPDNFIIKRNLYYFISKYLIKNTDHNIAVSNGLADLYYNLQLTDKKFPVIPHGINVPEMERIRRTKLKIDDHELIIVGRLEKIKGHEFLVNAMPKVLSRFPSTRLKVLGEGSCAGELIKQIKALGLEDKVDFLGFQSDPYSFILQSDIVVLPSLFEAFGLVYIESFALGVPVVAFDTAAGNEIMKNNETALLVEKRNVGEIADKIIYLLEKPGKGQELAANAYQVYLNHYTKEKMIENTVRWYGLNIIN